MWIVKQRTKNPLVASLIAHLSEGIPMDALRMKTPPWDIQGIECAVWVRSEGYATGDVEIEIWRTWTRGSQLGFRVYEIQNRGMILADSSLILLILQSRFSLNFGWFRPNLTDSEWFLLILTDSGFKIDYFSSDYCVILSDSEQGCTKIVLSCDPLGIHLTSNKLVTMRDKLVLNLHNNWNTISLT